MKIVIKKYIQSTLNVLSKKEKSDISLYFEEGKSW